MRAFEFLTEAAAQSVAPQVAQAQADIANKVKGIFDIDELNQIYSYIRKMDLGGSFENIFEKDTDLRQVQTILSKAIIDIKAPFDQKMAFAKELVSTGIIDVTALLTPGVTQKITDLVSTQYPEIYQGIAGELMGISGAFKSGKVKTNRGKGEFFLAILSPQIMLSKEGRGDLTINGQGYEVKDNLARIKGRKGYGSVDQAKQAVIKDVTKFVDQQVAKNPDSPLAGKTFSVGVGAQQNFWTEFGPLAIQGGADPNSVVKFVKDMWAKTIRALYLNITNKQLESISPFNEQGVLNFKANHNPMKALAFDYYKTADGFNGVFFVNSATMTITYVETAEQFISLIGIKKYGFETGAQNGMQVATP
jgi:hypothetical protein